MGRLIKILAPLLLCLAVLTSCTSNSVASRPTPPPTRVPPTARPTTPPATPAPPTREPVLAPTSLPTSPPTAEPTAEPTTAPTSAPAAPTSAPAAPTSAPTAAPTGAPALAVDEQLLFLRGGDLVALSLASGQTTTLGRGVSDFAASADGQLLAVAQGAGTASEIWLVRRATGEARQLTSNGRVESSLSWAPDGSGLVYTSAPTARPAAPDWRSWSEWCGAAEARILALATGVERTLGAGCEPTFGPDSKRIVFTAAPTANGDLPFRGANNALVMVNRQGENGWRVAFADGVDPEQGQLVYSPAWAPDAGTVSYQRFIGYRALVDLNYTESSSSYQRNGAPIGLGAGWMLPPRFRPDGRQVAVTEHNFGDARGFTGYDVWSTAVLRLGEASSVAAPSGELALSASELASLPRATGAAWAPDGAALAVLLPAGWEPGVDRNDPRFPGEGPGELWRWRPGAEPEARLAEGVDYGSPLLWLPRAGS